ncbi:MAG: hypothetical protein PHY47_21825 [Lachnospiraceae bacterium]|nr:hypothetical protein [Lachnospiraceae bacterium]
MDLNNLLYLLGFIVLILVVSRFMKEDESSTTSHTTTQTLKTINPSDTYNQRKEDESPTTAHTTTQTLKTINPSETDNQRIGTSNVDTSFNNILNFLKNEVPFRFGINKKEKDYQQDLEGRLSVLKERYGYHSDYEFVNGKHRIDFVINGNIGIEMKVHRGGTQVSKELYNQITDYAQYCNKLIGLVVNVTTDDAEILRMQIKDKLKNQHAINVNNYEIIVLDVNKR